MNALDEMSRRYRHGDDEIDPITAKAEDPDVTPEELSGMVNKIFSVGFERRKELDALCKAVRREVQPLRHLSDGTYSINYAHVGQYADFSDRANHDFLKEKYKWLHSVGDGLGFDEDKGAESHHTFEDFLASIPHEDWTDFLSDMDDLSQDGVLDEQGAQDLEMKEQDRWMKEDGAPDLVKAMMNSVDDAYEAYLLQKVTPDMVWEWCHDTDHYPESQGEGSVWMDMDRLGKERETQEWFLEQLEDDLAGWEQAKKAQFDDLAGDLLDRTLHDMAGQDERVAFVYNRIDGSRLWEIFKKTFPDEPQHEGDPYWYWWKMWDEEQGRWRVGYKSELHNVEEWKGELVKAFGYLKQQEWFWNLIRNWESRGPEDHPEFKFEAKEQAPLEQEPDPDDPETFIKYGGGIMEDLLYEDDKIIALYPHDYQSLNFHLEKAGLPPISKQNWNDLFKYKDVFVIQGKQPVDLLGRRENRELAVIWGDSDIPLKVWTGSLKAPTLQEVLDHPEYGRSIRKMLLRFYRERLETDSKASQVLLQLGGARELRRGERRGHIDLKEHTVALGLYYVAKHKYRLAAKAFNRLPKTMTPQGVWLIYDAVEDLVSVFQNDKAASTVLAHDAYDWFDNMELPPVSDVVDFLDKSAIDHIRSVMINRRVWFPDGGPDGRGDWVVLTKKVLDQYDDSTILDWIANPAQEDEDEGVWDDIIEAVRYAGSDILSSAAQDKLYTGYVEAAVDGIGGTKHKWGTHPTKKYKSGESFESFEVFVPWSAVKEFAEKYRDEHGYDYSGDLESMVVDVNADTVNMEHRDFSPSWSDVNKEWAKENLHRIHELEPPDPIPGSPDYVDPDQMEFKLESLGVDDPEVNPRLFSGIPLGLERQVEHDLEDYAHVQGIQIKDVALEFGHKSDEMYELRVRFRPEGAMLDLLQNHDYLWEWLMRVRLYPLVLRAYGVTFEIAQPVLEDCRDSHPGCVCILFPLLPKQPEEELPF